MGREIRIHEAATGTAFSVGSGGDDPALIPATWNDRSAARRGLAIVAPRLQSDTYQSGSAKVSRPHASISR